jgi:hypothetical protein
VDRAAGPAHLDERKPGKPWNNPEGGIPMPKYLMLARSNDQAWKGISAEEAQRIVRQYVDWSNRMREAGRLAGSNKLKDGEGRVLSGNGGQMSVKDGPYSETKEVVGGYWLVEAADFDEAVKLAKDSPHLRFGTIEIRAIEEM